jgi:hypothetical protein
MNINKEFDPKEIPFPGFSSLCHQLDLSDDVQTRLRNYLEIIKEGDSRILISSPFKNVDLKVLLSEVDNLIESNKDKLNSVLYSIEMSQRDKFGPRSVSKSLNDRIPDIRSYFEASSSVRVPQPLSASNGFRPIGLANAVKLLKNNTNSGLPYFTRKSKVKSNVLKDLQRRRDKVYPCILFTRTQEGGKTRTVWGYPIYDTIREMQYYSPLLKFQKSKTYRKALINADAVDNALTEIINKAVNNSSSSYTIVSIDFSSYDATVKSELQKVCFEYIKNQFAKQYHNDIDDIANRFNTIPLITPLGIFEGKHGVPSGSTFTNEVDSIAQVTIAKESTFLTDDLFQVQGDDGVYLIQTENLDQFIECFENCGLKVNRDKTVVSKVYATYLQNLYHPDFRSDTGHIRGIYPIYRALNRIVFQERWTDLEAIGLEGEDYFSLRTISILENTREHPLFKGFVDIILKYDKFSLNFGDSGLAKYIKFISGSSGNDMFINHHRGNDLKGVHSFETVKYIKDVLGSRA